MGVFKKVANRLVDIRVDKWMSLSYISETTNRFKGLLTEIVVPKKATYSETFEEAMLRLELTEADIMQRKKEFTRLCYFFVVLAIGVLGYALYLAFTGTMIAALIAFCLSFYAFTQAFRFHFWLFQLKHRKLGCTFKEWLNSTVHDVHHKEMIVKKESKNIIRDKEKK